MHRQAERVRHRGFGSSGLVAVLLFCAALGGLAWVYSGMVAKDRWPIRWLEVDGMFDRVSAEQVRTRVMPYVGYSFFALDLVAIDAAARSLPWVAEVRVQKLWPDTVKLTLWEFRPIAHWNEGRLLSSEGVAFEVPGADAMQGLPWLEGPEDALEEVLARWQEFDSLLQPTGLEIARMRLDRRGAWNMVLSNGTTVALGRELPGPRLKRMVMSWPQLLLLKDVPPAGLDLRYSNGMAVRWPEPAPQKPDARAG